MRPTFPAPLARGALRMSVTAGLRRTFAVRDQDTGQIVAEFDTSEEANALRDANRDALGMLASCLASAPGRRGA